MQNKPSNDQHKSIYYRLRRSDPHERLSARLRHFSFGAAVFFVVAAAGIVTHSLYNIQIKQGATFRQYAAQQQLLDSTIQATRGEIYDASGITLASTSVVWTIWADPSYSTALFTSQTVEETGEAVKTVDETTLADVSRQLTLRLLSGDGESLDSVDTSSAEYQTQYQTVHDALAKNGRHQEGPCLRLFVQELPARLPLRRVRRIGAGLLQRRRRGLLRPRKILQ